MDTQATRHSMDSKSLAFQAYRRLEEMIVMLELKPGELLSEGSLCERIGIGRTPVREALKRLADDSLVSVLTRRGIQITQIDVKQQLYLVELRRELEALVCGRAARRRTEDEVAQFRQLEKDMIASAKKSDVVAFLKADRTFSRLASTASRNPYLQRAITPLHSVSRRFWYVNYQKNQEFDATVDLHVDLIRAILAGDEKAAIEASRKHMDSVETSTRLAMDLDI
ncbi:MAG: GntR family transcriptional regulator [Hyphomicrobiales bacterium]|nr:GntR family transcriptional regulator [Hyphomicrobiales bacterium]